MPPYGSGVGRFRSTFAGNVVKGGRIALAVDSVTAEFRCMRGIGYACYH